jgi:hypothetical protein
MMFVIDVASEEHNTYYLPKEPTDLDPSRVHTFNLCGQLCVVKPTVSPRRMLGAGYVRIILMR